MDFIGFLIIGLLAGGIAGRITGGRSYGCIGNIVVGAIGAMVGGWLFRELGWATPGGACGSLVTATVGAIAFLAVLNLFRR